MRSNRIVKLNVQTLHYCCYIKSAFTGSVAACDDFTSGPALSSELCASVSVMSSLRGLVTSEQYSLWYSRRIQYVAVTPLLDHWLDCYSAFPFPDIYSFTRPFLYSIFPTVWPLWRFFKVYSKIPLLNISTGLLTLLWKSSAAIRYRYQSESSGATIAANVVYN